MKSYFKSSARYSAFPDISSCLLIWSQSLLPTCFHQALLIHLSNCLPHPVLFQSLICSCLSPPHWYNHFELIDYIVFFFILKKHITLLQLNGWIWEWANQSIFTEWMHVERINEWMPVIWTTYKISPSNYFSLTEPFGKKLNPPTTRSIATCCEFYCTCLWGIGVIERPVLCR